MPRRTLTHTRPPRYHHKLNDGSSGKPDLARTQHHLLLSSRVKS